MSKQDNVLENVVNAVSTGIDAEISSLREDAHGRIVERTVARSYINENLLKYPELVSGTHMVGFTNERGDRVAKEQSRNLSLWTVTLQTVIERGNSSYQHLGAMFISWAKDTLGVNWHPDAAQRVAKKFINVLQVREVLSSEYSDYDYIDEETNMPKTTRVFLLHTSFNDVFQRVYTKLCNNAHYHCRPLYHAPADWVDNFTGIGERAGLQLVKNFKRKRISDNVLRAVNKLQSVLFTVPECMIDAAYDLLDNQHEFPCTDEELMLYSEIVKYANTNFYFPITMDSRGRMYYRGGLLTPQGTDFCKAAFQFAVPERLGNDGLDAICVHLANCLGHDKLSLRDRINAIWSYVDSGTFDGIKDHVDVRATFPDADTYQALVAILDLVRINNDMMVGGIKAQHCWSALVCHQDGTCNGLQHMSAITHNRQTAETVNCTTSTCDDEPRDVYGIIAQAALEYAETDVVANLLSKYGRSMAKNPVMITGYGAGEDTIIANTREYLRDKGESDLHGEAVAQCYIAAINKHAGAVKAMTAAIKSRMKAAYADGMTRFKWRTADGFDCDIEYRDYEPARVRAGKFNALLRGVECNADPVKTVGAMAPNFIHSIDATHLRMVVNECDWDLVTVHDSIGSHPCNFFATNRIIREQFAKVHEYDAMKNLCDGMKQRAPKFRGDYNATEALGATYIFS